MLIALCLISAAIFTYSDSAAESVCINLKEEAVVRADGVVLKDVADLQSADSKSIETLAQTPLCAAPPFGVTATLSRNQILDILRKNAGFAPDARFTGATIVQIRLEGKPVQPEEIARIIKRHIAETTSWKESEIEIQSVENLEGIDLPPGDVHLQVSSRSPVVGRGKIVFPVEALQDGKVRRMFWTTARIRIHAEMITAAKAIRPGMTVLAEDVIRSRKTISDVYVSCLRTPDEILGKISRRAFSPGDPLVREAFIHPYLVKSGETVHLRLERSGLVLTALGRAEQDGRLGQIIKVRSLEFSTLLNAQVTGKAEARIQ